MEDSEKLYGLYRDDGTVINPELIPKPSQCISCTKDDDPQKEIPCILTRAGQQGEWEFICHAFDSKSRRTKCISS
ncbi:hypothetical protein YTPLAS72_02230 [Nitrospira sp.]|nr:hypothetical protein YTPLAS72_02230 [Nitrospira sp.]